MSLFIAGLMLGLVFGAVFQKFESDEKIERLRRENYRLKKGAKR